MLSLALVFSCKKSTIITDSSAKLAFSQNAVLFDTVFTTVGSTVQAFLVHNNNNQPIVVSSIKLVGNYTSPFKMNVDGTAGTSFSNVKIPANDSIYVFVTVTLNPNNVNNPLVIEDSIQFTTNGNIQDVYLEAWGQDAYFHKPNVFPPVGPAYSIVKCGDIWTNDKPHVIFGYLVVDSGCTLTMQPGTKVCMHNNAVLWVYKAGKLIINGAHGSEVTVQGDRLEPEYQNVPGQWGEIWLSPGSDSCKISWAIIKNGTIGVEADTVANWLYPTLKIDHTIIKSMSEYGLLGLGSYIVGDDNVVADCQYYCVDLSIGGKYSFAQCTFANYWSYGQRQTTLLLINNWYQDINGNFQSRAITQAFFGNCIVYGSLQEEVGLDSAHGGAFNYYFKNCLLSTQHSTPLGFHYNDSIQVNIPPPFRNTAIDDYYLTNSIGYDNFIICNQNPLDLNDMGRSCPSDMGAYQH